MKKVSESSRFLKSLFIFGHLSHATVLVNIKIIRRMVQIFVAFSEKLNFIKGGQLMADAHFASKNTLFETHTLLLKRLTHFAAKNTWQDTL